MFVSLGGIKAEPWFFFLFWEHWLVGAAELLQGCLTGLQREALTAPMRGLEKSHHEKLNAIAFNLQCLHIYSLE